MHQFSDSDTPDSDEGIRFKTDSTRNKETNKKLHRRSSKDRRRSSKSRSRSLERRRNHRRREDKDRNNTGRERDKYRRRSHSRERHTRYKSKETTKYERTSSKFARERSKRSASLELKNDLNKRRKEHAIISKRDSDDSKPREDRKKSHSKERDIKSKEEQLAVSMNPQLPLKDAESSNDDDLEAFGPALPPNLLLNKSADSISQEKYATGNDDEFELEEDVKSNQIDTRTFSKVSTSPISSEDDLAKDGETYGPVLPNLDDSANRYVIEIEDSDVEAENAEPNAKNSSLNSSLPHCYDTDMAVKAVEDDDEDSKLVSRIVGPFLPEDFRQKLLEEADEDEIEEGEIVGPILPGATGCLSATQIALEERALQFKLDRLNSANSASDAIVREDWMISLPDAGAAVQMIAGLGPRQFRAKAGPDLSDRSGWTETPKEREAKLALGKPAKDVDNGADLKAEAASLEIKQRDQEQERNARRHHKKHRKKDKKEKSLLELHQDKLKSKQNVDEDGQNIRRPFNRDTDLKVNQFDDAQKRAIYKKAQLLDDRFSKGASKYL